MAKTYEMRLIDANALDREAEESLRENPHTEGIHRAMHTHEHNHFLCMIAHQPTIDPETIPVVRQLREELAREKRLCDDLQKDLAVTANERNAALDRVRHYAGCWECKMREEGNCAMPFCKDRCSGWEWRGPQKEE